MKIKLIRNKETIGFQLTNSFGVQSNISDNTEEAQKATFSPMESLLSALAGCMSIDVLHILKKQKIEPKIYTLDIEGIRKDVPPRSFTKIILNFKISNEVSIQKVERAIELSKNKYCSVSKSLNDNVEIIHSIEIVDLL